jgi:hypothetical protein
MLQIGLVRILPCNQCVKEVIKLINLIKNQIIII